MIPDSGFWSPRFAQGRIGCWGIINAEALATLKALDDDFVDLIATDPPYFKVKNEPWDRQWDKPEQFLAWLDTILAEFHRVLKPNGSLYLFASPRMAARVEVLVGKRFNIVNRITWAKPAFSTKAEMFRKGDLRGFFPSSEAIIFAEHYGADNMAKGEAGYGAKCDELRGFLFEPLRAYLDGERKRAGIDKIACNVACGFSASPGGMASRHYFSRSQWWLPTPEHYAALRDLFNRKGGDYLKREYDDLKREYESLRRPFSVTADDQYTDVWSFKTVGHYKGKHPCEKPLPLMRQIVNASSREDALVLDPFMGSGTTGVAAVELGRKFIGIDMSEKWCKRASERIRETESRLF